MRSAIDPTLMATDLADYLVCKGIAFRDAHRLAGEAVRAAARKGLSLDQLSLNEWQALGPFEADVVQVFDAQKSVEKRNTIGGTSPQSVKEQIAGIRQLLSSEKLENPKSGDFGIQTKGD
jgi:argininosuccinate lyase